MRRNGFTLIEMLLVVVILGLVTLLAIKPMRETQQSSRVRGAKVAAATYVVTARTTAITRGCRSTVHFTQGASATAWITACRLTSRGAVTTLIDTVGSVDQFGTRVGVTLTSTVDSIPFDAQGLFVNGAKSVVRFTKGSPASVDSFVVSPLGMVIQ